MKIDISTLDDKQKVTLVQSRYASSSTIAEKIKEIYSANTRIYENNPTWIDQIPYIRAKWRVHANRIFVNMESVINSLIANPPGVNILPSRQTTAAQDFARDLESLFRKKYVDLNWKEVIRMGLRNLYFGRLLVIKPFWNPVINDFDFRALDPRKVRVGKYARKEQDSEFVIEDVDDNLAAVCERFPKRAEELQKKFGITTDADLFIKNPDITYQEAWINDYIIFRYEELILDCVKNVYWDWDGVLVTEEEESQLVGESALEGDQRRQLLQKIKLDQDQRQPVPEPEQPGLLKQGVQKVKEFFGAEPSQGATAPEGEPERPDYRPYLFNYFNHPRKPYIFATIFNNENSPIGRTDMITLSAELQRGIDKRKMDIDENCELVNGIIKVDSGVMGKSDAQRIRWETRGIVWGKGVKDGVTREVGNPLPQMVFDDMIDSRSEIDNIMAASSAFRGEREGQETKAGRLALIQQSYLRLNELVQVVDYVSHEMFAWGMQLSKTRYTEYHYAKWMGKEGAQKTFELIQDDFEDGIEATVIAGKSLPVDDEFKFEQAQNDVEKGYISPPDYLEIAKYDNAKELSKNAVLYQQNPMKAVGIESAEMPVPFAPGQLTPEQVVASAASASATAPPPMDLPVA